MDMRVQNYMTQEVLDLDLEDYGAKPDAQVQATRKLLAVTAEGATLTAMQTYLGETMLNIARNWDALAAKGRDTSRVMAQLLDCYQRFVDALPDDGAALAPEVAELLASAAK
jgi:hypothetical protein